MPASAVQEKPAPSQQAQAHAHAHALSSAERKQRQSDLLDEGLKETFPASDPVSVALVE